MRIAIIVCLAVLGQPAMSSAGQTTPTAEDLAERRPNPAQPDFTLVNLPTTLRVPRFKSSFRVTHRFTRPLGAGGFDDLASDLFGLDSGALIGLEYRFGLMRGFQVGVLRTSDKTIDLFAHYNAVRQGETVPVAVTVLAAIDGTDNFSDLYSPSLGVVVSRELGTRGALYFEPIWVADANLFPRDPAEHMDTLLLGLGTRLRISRNVYVVGEFVPRLGYDPGVHHGTFAIEKRMGGHVFQVNFSNGFGNTPGQLARGGTGREDWYLGFNISRKFF